MSELKEILIRKHLLDGIDSLGLRPVKAINFSDMDISELRGMASFLYEQYLKTCEEKEQLLKTQAILISQSEENKKSLEENKKSLEDIKGLLCKKEEERDGLKSQLDAITAKLAEAMDIISKLSKENARLKMETRNLKEETNVLKENTFGSKSHKMKRNRPNTDKASEDKASEDKTTTDDDDDDETPSTGDTGQAETAVEVKEKETRSYRMGLKYNKGGVKDNVILHKSDLTKLPEGSRVLEIRIQKVFHKIEMNLEHDVEIVHYLGPDGKVYAEYLPVDGEYSEIASLQGTSLDWEQLTRIPDRFQGTRASVNLLVDVIYNTTTMSIPFYRKIIAFLEDEFTTCRQTLINWMGKVTPHLKQVFEIIKKKALEKDSIVNCDETWCRVKLKNKKRKKGYIWCLVNKAAKIVMFFFDKGSRGRAVLTDFLGDADLKALQSDAYNAYYYLDKEQCGIEHLCCMAHVRAKFFLAWKQGLDQSAKGFLKLIWKLYKAEREYQKLGYTAEEIYKARNSKETQKIIDDLQNLLYDTMIDGRDKGRLMTDALGYLHDYWKQVMAYRNDGRYSIDNSIAERAIRPMTIERKNKVAFGSEAGAEMSCLFHTINETIKLQGKSIKKYYRELLTAVNSGRRDYENLTPVLIG